MSNGRQRRVTKAHERSYADPITLAAGDGVTITQRELWDGVHVWLWCIGPTGKAGWVPERYLQVDGEQGQAVREYSAWELTVSEGQTLTVLDEDGGWAGCEAASGERGWVPVSCFGG